MVSHLCTWSNALPSLTPAVVAPCYRHRWLRTLPYRTSQCATQLICIVTYRTRVIYRTAKGVWVGLQMQLQF